MPSWASRFGISAEYVKSVTRPRLLITRKRSAQAVGSGVKERNALARGSGTAKYISDSLGQVSMKGPPSAGLSASSLPGSCLRLRWKRFH
nr:Hypothetical protein [Pseudomonas aeruginosa]